MSARRLAAVAFAFPLVAVVVACGSPDSPRKTFIFTPIPYTPVTDEFDWCTSPGCGDAMAETEDGGLYFADIVLVIVENERAADRVRELVDSYGFDVRRQRPFLADGEILMTLKVPAGAAPAAADWLATVDGVLSAEPNGIGRVLQKYPLRPETRMGEQVQVATDRYAFSSRAG